MTNEGLIAKIKAEIERRKGYISVTHFTEELLSVLSDLEKEEKPSEELEEEIKRYYEDMDGDCRYVQTARHFAKWQKEEMISALKNDGELPTEFIDKFHEIDRTAFQNGQKNMRENMMKEAVEGEVEDVGIKYIDLIDSDAEKLGLVDGQKVRIIIVKEKKK